MKLLTRIVLALYFASILLSCQAQSPGRVKRPYSKSAGDKEFSLLRYQAAAGYYLQADTNETGVIEQLAACFIKLNDYDKAEHWLKKESTVSNQSDEFYLNYAKILANQGKYALSSHYYGLYNRKVKADHRAAQLALNSNHIQGLYRDSSSWKIRFLALNTIRDEYSPIYYRKGLVFTSNRESKFLNNSVFGWNQSSFSTLYAVEDTSKVKYLAVTGMFARTAAASESKYKHESRLFSANDTPVYGDSQEKGNSLTDKSSGAHQTVKEFKAGLNSRYNNGPLTLTGDQNELFYTRNHFDPSFRINESKGVYKLDLFTARFSGGVWSQPEPFLWNDNQFSTAHPALSPNGLYLYFVSDIPGGTGGKDLYYSGRRNRSTAWTKPVNLGSLVNTEGDEEFPYVSPDGSTLYFSSDGHFGLGGLDIFKVPLVNGLPSAAPVNLGYPVNSSKDDFGIVMKPGGATGLFSSNRYGSDDIFGFSYHPVFTVLDGKVLADSPSQKAVIDSALVKIVSGNTTDSLYTDASGAFKYHLYQGHTYVFEASKNGYVTSSKTINQAQAVSGGSSGLNLLLRHLSRDSSARTLASHGVRSGSAITDYGTEAVYYSINSWDLSVTSLFTLEKVISLLRENPLLRVIITSHSDSRESETFVLKLAKTRSNTIVKFLIGHHIPPGKIKSTTYRGEAAFMLRCPRGVKCTEAQQMMNRRTDIRIVAYKAL